MLNSAELVASLAETFPEDRLILANSLVQAARRRGIPLQDYWWRLLDQHALPTDLEQASAPFELVEPVTPSPSVRLSTVITIPAVADALTRLSNGKAHSEVERILNIPTGEIAPMCIQLERWLQKVYREHFPRRAKHESATLSWSDLLEKMHIDFYGMHSPTWFNLSAALEKGVDPRTLNGAIWHWVTNGHGIYLPLTPTDSARPLITLLQAGEVERDHVRVIVQRSQPSIEPGSLSDPDPSHAIAQLFEQERRVAPRFETTNWRCDRPMAYLQINPHATKARTAGKSEQSGALKAWLIAIKAHQFLTSNSDTND